MDSNVLSKLKIAKYKRVVVINAPNEFTEALKDFKGQIDTQLSGIYDYIQIFIMTQSEIIEKGESITSSIEEDGPIWICYPKGSSKRYKKVNCNRDTLREALIQYGF